MQALDAEVIRLLIAPAAVIPACGLLILSTSARMNALLARIRAMHHERLEVYVKPSGSCDAAGRVREARLEGLEHQTHKMLERATRLRNTMVTLFCAIVCLVCCSLSLGLSGAFGTVFETIGVAFFAAGMLALLAAMVNSLLEMATALHPIRYEHERVERVCAVPADDAGRAEAPNELEAC